MYCYTQFSQPCSRPLLETTVHYLPGKSGSVSCGVTGLPPGSWYSQVSICAFQESISHSCVSSGSSMVRLMATSSKKAYAIPKSAAPWAPAPVAVHSWPIPPQMFKQFCLSLCGVSWPWCAQDLFELFESLWWKWCLILLCPWMWGISSQLFEHLPYSWGFSDLAGGISPHVRSSATQPPHPHNIKFTYICLVGVTEEEKRDNMLENIGRDNSWKLP